MIVDTCIDHVPERLWDDPKLLDGFLSSVPRGYGEIAYVGQTEKGARQMIVEKPKGVSKSKLCGGRLHPGGQASGDGRLRRGYGRDQAPCLAGMA